MQTRVVEFWGVAPGQGRGTIDVVGCTPIWKRDRSCKDEMDCSTRAAAWRPAPAASIVVVDSGCSAVMEIMERRIIDLAQGLQPGSQPGSCGTGKVTVMMESLALLAGGVGKRCWLMMAMPLASEDVFAQKWCLASGRGSRKGVSSPAGHQQSV
ncbi:hypothetical protein CCHR01_05858 [Colletotrichum chrysophilum]|uniref:Uncharacterized protein n=1 Tax=Colletotrichum chrysophilum TaxID=1836956 RepID=A0AAD9EK70_9PEZI|nr:hypothetical protein CCHR01_05858 [Colletotrichum chrysophilum]